MIWTGVGTSVVGRSRPPGGGAAFSPLDLSPALWVDPSDASSVTISGSSGAYIGANGLVLPAATSNSAFSPDIATTRPTGDFTLYADLTLTDWTPAALQYITLNGNEGALSTLNWLLYVQTTGELVLSRPTGSTARSFASTAATGVTDGTRKKIKVTFDQDNGSAQSEVKFYLSDDGTSWTQLGSAVTNANTGAGNSNTTGLRIGTTSGGANPLGGTAHSVKLYSDLTDTTKVFDADFESATPFVSAFTESALGAPVYVVSSTATSATANYGYVGPTGLVCTSGVPASSLNTAGRFDVTGDIDIIVKASAVTWAPSAGKIIMGLSSSSAQAWYFQINSSNGLGFTWVDAGATTRGANSSSALSITAGATKWVRVTLDVDNGAGGCDTKFWTSDDGSSWTQLGTTQTQAFTTSIRTTVNDMRVGNANPNAAWNGTIMRAIVKNGIAGTTVFDADFAAAADYAASFAESSSSAATVTIDTTNTPANAAGACVSQINDKSGNARHLTQGTLANMPKYWNGQNGNNCLVFDGTNDYLGGGDVLDLGTASLSFYSTSLLRSGAAATLFGKYKVTPQAGMWLSVVQTSGTHAYEGTYVDATTTSRTSRGPALTLNQWAMHGSIVDRTAGTVVERFNEADGPTTAAFTPDAATNHNVAASFYVGALRNTTDTGWQAAYWWNGFLGEVVVNLSALGTTDRNSLEGYMQPKWGTP